MRKKKGAQEISNEVLCAEYEAVYHYALSICRNETEAQDLTQETFLKAMNAVESFKGNSSLYTWLCAIAKNLWINRCKKQSREIIPENIAEMGQDDQPSIEQQVADKETAMHIVRNISIAKYHANTSIKRNSYYDVALEELESCLAASITVEQEIAANELSKQIDRFLATLDEESQMLFVRRYWYSDDISDLADRFHMNNNNVSVRLSRIRNKLKNYLQKEGYEI